MKIRLLFVYAFSLLAAGNLLKAQLELPLTFDEAMEFTFTDFGPDLEGGRPADKVTQVAADPDNAENMVAAVIKPAGAEVWSGVTFWDAKKIPVSETDTKISVRVRTPEANTPILLKLENNLANSFFVEKIVTNTKADEWEIVTFDFSNPTNGALDFDPLQPVYNRMSIFFNFGSGGGATDTTHYFEDVILGAPEVLNLPFDFESDALAYDFGEGGGFDGGISTILDNPDPSGINTSSKVVQMVKNAGQVWGGSTLALDGPLNFAGAKAISMDVWSPRAGVPVLLKLEGETPVELTANTATSNAWETLTYDFGDDAEGTYTGVTLIFDNGTAGDGSANFTFYYDNIVPAPETVDLPLDFENSDLFYFFNNFAGGVTERIENPDKSGINESDFVARQVRSGGETFAGSSITLPGGLDFSESTIFKMKVWSPAADVPVLLKLEPSDPPVEVIVNTTTAEQWEELTFDFTGKTEGEFTGLTFIFNINTVGDGSANSTYYFDNVLLEGASSSLNQVDVPVTFDPGVNYAFTDFGEMGQTVIGDDPVEGASNPVARATRTPQAMTWAGTTIGEPAGFANPFPFSDTATQLSMRVYAPAAGIPVRLKVEDAANNMVSAETEAVTTVANMWETLVFDFGQPAAGTASVSLDNTYDKLSVFFNFGTDGATAGEQIFYYDDILWTGQTIDGIGGPAKPALPITFDLPAEEVDYTVTDFGGNVTILGPDPVDATNVVAITQKSGGAELWAGTTMSSPSGLGEPIPLTVSDTKMSVRVFSPDAGIPVRLKVEDKTDPTKSVETEAMTTVANAWETLVFDFSNEAEGTAALNPDYTFDLASIFFNFGTTGAEAGEKIYYWDDVMFIDSTPRAVGEEVGSNTITLTADPTPDIVPGLLVFLDDGTEVGAIQSIAGRVITLASSLSVTIPADSRLTFVEDNTGGGGFTGGKFRNMSTRGHVGTGDRVIIGGIVIGTDKQDVLIQAIGPELGDAGVTDVLLDPVLTITNTVTGEEIAVNDNWEDDGQAQLISDLWGGAPPFAPGSLSAAVFLTLDPGRYTGKIEGKDGTTGNAIIEIYQIDD